MLFGLSTKPPAAHSWSATALKFFTPLRGRSFRAVNPAPCHQATVCGDLGDMPWQVWRGAHT